MKSLHFPKHKVYETMNVCWICKKRVMQGASFVCHMETFACGHVYHKNCAKDRKTCFACDTDRILCKFTATNLSAIVDDDEEVSEFRELRNMKPGEIETAEDDPNNNDHTKKLMTLRALNNLDLNLHNNYYLSLAEF